VKKWSNDKLELDRDILKDAYYLFDVYQRYTTDGSLNNLNKIIDIIKIKFMSINGQSKAEYQKNFKRVSDIVQKSAGDKDVAVYLSKQQAYKITDEIKCINRAMAAKEMNQEHIFEVFFQRAYELGSVSKQDYRNYKLEKLGI
jgi:Xaa-Pro aminopeptidase